MAALRRVLFRAMPVAGELAPLQPAANDGDETFVALGYRQTRKPAAEGGKANGKGVRVRNELLAELAPMFRGKPFLTGHDWGDVRARGGTILDAEVAELSDTDEVGVQFRVQLTAPWAIEARAQGAIQFFSWGVEPEEIVCTVHRGAVFAECYCMPGEMGAVERDGKMVEVEVEWEIIKAAAAELSAVNVPAVEGTGIVEDKDAGPVSADEDGMNDDSARLVATRTKRLRELSKLCGRRHPELETLQRPRAPIAPPAPIAPAAITFAADVALALGLAADATPEQVRARAGELAAAEAATRLRREQTALAADQAHVDSAIDELIATRQIAYGAVQRLRTTFASGGRSAFDRDLELAREIAPARPVPLTRTRAVLQSDAAPANTDRSMLPDDEVPRAPGDSPDAWEQHAHNEALPLLMKVCSLTPADLRKHGPRAIRVLHNLGELVADTMKRGG